MADPIRIGAPKGAWEIYNALWDGKCDDWRNIIRMENECKQKLMNFIKNLYYQQNRGIPVEF